MRAVLFDFFGTLVEYQPDRAKLASPQTHQLARSLGFGGDHDNFVSAWDHASKGLEQRSGVTLREFSMTDAAIAFADAADLHITPTEAAALGRAYVQEWSRQIHPIPGVADMIQQLASTLAVAVVSNTHDSNMVPSMLTEMRVSEYVSAVVLSVDHGKLKPHPSIYIAALDLLGCTDPGQAVFVGDSYTADYLGPITVGMAAFLIDPANAHDIPASDRLASVLDITGRIHNWMDR
ncbi:MAG: HAD family hydrolase [Actinomycetota bacterium]